MNDFQTPPALDSPDIKRRGKRKRSAAAVADERVGTMLFAEWGVLLASLIASLILVLQHFGVIALPPSFSSEASWFSALGWPFSFLGLAYFCGLSVGFGFQRRHEISGPLRLAIRGGAIVSAFCLASLAWGLDLCLCCLAANLGNLLFWLFMERRSNLLDWRPILALAVVFALVCSALGVVHVDRQRALALQEERSALERAKSPLESPRPEPEKQLREGALEVESPSPEAPAVPLATNGKKLPSRVKREPFRMGAESAPIQLVVYFDYQSPNCQRLEREIQALISRYPETVALSIRHFPGCTDCNFSIKTSQHPLACQAALAVESAGALQGNDGFWKMHRWLLKRNGEATPQELESGWLEFGYENPAEFIETMNRRETLQKIMADVVDAQVMQVKAAPEVLINDERIWGAMAENAIVQAVEAVRKNTSNSPGESGGFSKELQEHAERATVHLVSHSQDSSGTGVILAQREGYVYILTASHVVQQAKDLEVRAYWPESKAKSTRIYTSVEVVADAPDADLALLRMGTRDEMPGMLSMCRSDAAPTEKLFPAMSVGYSPSSEDRPTLVFSHVTNTVVMRRQAGGPIAKYWQVNRESEKGRSGGPLIDSQGRVIGIASGVSKGKGYFCHLTAIEQFLTKSGNKWLLEG